MSEIFGVPMTGIMAVLLVLLGICLLVIAWIAVFRPIMFRIGLRNIPRRPAETILVIIGLMLSTLIIAAALGTGDTVDYSITAQTYDNLGAADELVVYSRTADGDGSIAASIAEKIPASVTAEVDTLFADSDLVDGVMPLLIETVPVFLFDEGPPPADANFLELLSSGAITQAEPTAYLAGIDSTRLDQFDDLKSVDGNVIDLAAIGENEIVISETMADDLNADVGDAVGFTYNNVPHVLTIAAIGEDGPLSGRFDTTTPGMVMDLDRMQSRLGIQEEITAVAVSNRGDIRSGMELTDQVTDELKAAFAGRDLGVDPIKQDSIDFANLFASIFTSFFLLFGLFSIGVGILLILLIFSMLAAERRPEMGMARAVGAQRAQLVQTFISEGTVYALFAGLLGALLGVGAAFAIGFGMRAIFGEFVDIQPHVTLKSMVVAYSLGVVITFIAVVVASARISRLNIVAAVRDIPDVASHVKHPWVFIWGVWAIIIGVFAAYKGLGSNTAFTALLGLSLAPFGLGLILRFFGVSSRLIYTLIGIYWVVFWLLPSDWSDNVLGELDGDIELFFVSGIFLVGGATLVIVRNLDVLLWIFSFIGSLFRSALPAIRMAIAFPSQFPSRTGMTIAMFSLIVFSLVVFATINVNFVNIFLGDEANAGWNVRADQGQANPIGDRDAFISLLDERDVDTSTFEAVGVGSSIFQARVNRPGETAHTYIVHGIDQTLIEESVLKFQQRAEGYPDDASIVQALLSDPTVAVIDSFALGGGGGFGEDDDQFRLDDADGEGPQQEITSDMKVFPAQAIEVTGATGDLVELKIIGIIDQKIGSLFGLYAAESVIQPIFPNPHLMSYFIRLEDEDQSDSVAEEVEQALLINGVNAVSIKDELEDAQRQNRGFLYIIQGFMGLGLIVGLAAVGVIAFRSVVERRQQIGVLRAIGFQPGMVTLSFLVEQLFVVSMGVISGSVLGLALAKVLFMDDEFAPSGTDFIVPWSIVLVILAVTIVAALLMTVIPARQASRLAPAEALRYE